jgi:Fic family protein
MVDNYILQIRAILKAGPYTQKALAENLGVTFAALNRWLNGHAVPHPAKRAAIARMHRELVGYAAISDPEAADFVRQAARFKKEGIWRRVASSPTAQEDLLLELTYNSTAIEGTTFTKNQTKTILFEKTLIPHKSLSEHLEVSNHGDVLRDILRKKLVGPITEAFIKQLHQRLMQGLRDDAGQYAQHQRAITGVNIALTHPKDIPEEMVGLIRRWRKTPRIKTLADIARFHAQFELIHPFGDGNGRAGRLLMILQCLEAGFPPVIIENSRKAEYYDVLEYAQRKSDGPFMRFLLDEMGFTDKILRKHI